MRRPTGYPCAFMNKANESWAVATRDQTVVLLVIPGALGKTRRFQVDAQLLARIPEGASASELGMSLEIDGARQWSRSAPSMLGGQTDSMEYQCRLDIPPGRDTRLRARVSLRHCSLVSLSLTAVEEPSA